MLGQAVQIMFEREGAEVITAEELEKLLELKRDIEMIKGPEFTGSGYRTLIFCEGKYYQCRHGRLLKFMFFNNGIFNCRTKKVILKRKREAEDA